MSSFQERFSDVIDRREGPSIDQLLSRYNEIRAYGNTTTLALSRFRSGLRDLSGLSVPDQIGLVQSLIKVELSRPDVDGKTARGIRRFRYKIQQEENKYWETKKVSPSED